jgi:DDE superfamily endonuclease
MSGKKKEKFCITVGIACNADGSEKLEPFFIGRARKPCCFKKQTPEQ